MAVYVMLTLGDDDSGPAARHSLQGEHQRQRRDSRGRRRCGRREGLGLAAAERVVQGQPILCLDSLHV